MSLLVGMVADDLTGALDATAPFAQRGLRTTVIVSPEGLAGPLPADAEVLCINTASREVPEPEARRRMEAAMAALLPLAPAILFKKIDSRLKGHVGIETQAMAQASGRGRVIAAPAIPDLGRLVYAGKLVGAGVPEPIPVAPRLLPLVAEVPEIPDQRALDAIGRAIVGEGSSCLAAGARGLAQAIAARLPARAAPPAPRPLPRPCLIAIGSRDPITRAQVERTLAALGPKHVRAPNGAVPPLTFGPGLTLVTTEPGTTTEAGTVVAARFAGGLAAAIAAQPPAAMLISGGETAYAVFARLGVSAIAVGGEAAPGTPFATTLIGDRQVIILTKSGGFGAPDTISLLVRQPQDLDLSLDSQAAS